MTDGVGPPQRRNPRLTGHDYRAVGAYFVTVCTDGRRCLFGEVVDDVVVLTPLGRLVQDAWDAIPSRHRWVATDAFVVMPNHVHGVIVQVTTPDGAMNRAPTGEVVRAWKARVTADARRRGLIGDRLWQRGYYDHIVRDEKDLHRVRQYIDNNPLAWALDEENPNRRPPRDV